MYLPPRTHLQTHLETVTWKVGFALFPSPFFFFPICLVNSWYFIILFSISIFFSYVLLPESLNVLYEYVSICILYLKNQDIIHSQQNLDF